MFRAATIVKRASLAARAILAGAALAAAQGAITGGVALAVTAGATINNDITVDYDVSGAAQTPATASVFFIVDEKIDVTVADNHSGAVANSPGETVTLTFDVTNTGNKDRDYAFTVAAIAGLSPVGTGAAPNAGEYSLDVDSAFIAEGATATVTLTYVVPAGATDGDTYTFELTATVDDGAGNKITESTGGGRTVEDRVYADDAGVSDIAQDGAFSDAVLATVNSATLAATKTVALIDDGRAGGFVCSDFGSTGSTTLAIPGACVEWTIEVTNSGAAAADDVTIDDTVPADVSVDAVRYTKDGGTSFITVAATNALSVNVGAVAGGGGVVTLTIRGTIQ